MKLHVGSGPCYIEGFYNIDKRIDVKTDYCGDVFDLADPSNPKHIKDGTVDFIWSCHFLEHLDYPDGVTLCLEVFYDWLVEGGLLRLAVPDLELIAWMYWHRDPRIFKLFGVMDKGKYHKEDSRAERFTFFARAWEHSMLFDFELLSWLLKDAGFKNITKRNFGESKLGKWTFDRLEIESMYVEAEK